MRLSGTEVVLHTQVRFTPVQVEALRSGLNPGLTQVPNSPPNGRIVPTTSIVCRLKLTAFGQVVGPPGTGKTDVAVQTLANLYHTFPEQRTLLVTHSNQALNDLFDKLLVLDIQERHLLRLGHGQLDLETEKDFSRFGRVNYMLGKRLSLLEEVVKLSKSIGLTRDINFTCESAANFYLLQARALGFGRGIWKCLFLEAFIFGSVYFWKRLLPIPECAKHS